MTTYQRYVKPSLDFICALVGVIVLLPLIVLLMLCIRIKLGGPVFFLQERGGKDGKRFRIMKFRTMLDAYDEAGQLLPDEQRLTPFGLFLRNSSLDELPALFNVLRGQMSLVGPRPFISDYLDYYTPHQKQRHMVKPGITGWAQVNGRNALTWEEKFELDIWYVKRQTFKLDAKIFYMTFKRVLGQKDISSADHATMPNFIEISKMSRD